MNGPRIALALCLFAAAALPAVFAEEEEAPVPGRITLSDGTVFEGTIRTTRGKPLVLFEAETGRRLDLLVKDIHLIRVHVTSEEQYRIWRWVEDGSREKVYTGESYPKRAYETEITLRNGQVHRGNIVAVVYIYPEGSAKPKKVLLKKAEQGEIGETLKDLIHVESIEFEGPAPDGTTDPTGIRLEVDPADLVLAAHALPRDRNRSAEGALPDGEGPVRFPHLLPGTYDLAVVTENRIFYALGVGADGGKVLTGAALEEVKARVAEIPDFFEQKTVLAGVSAGDKIRALVFKERQGPTSMGGERTFRRWEIWSLRKGGDRWLVDNRSYVWRDHGESLPPPAEVVWSDKLLGIGVESGVAEVKFRIPGEDE
jgi:hypothetical protein